MSDEYPSFDDYEREAEEQLSDALTRVQPAPADVVTDEQIIELINLVTDLADADALDRAIPEVRAKLSATPVSGEVERLRKALRTIHDRFAKDLEQGYVTKDKTYAVEIARQALTPPRSIRVSDLTDEEVEAMRKPSA